MEPKLLLDMIPIDFQGKLSGGQCQIPGLMNLSSVFLICTDPFA